MSQTEILIYITVIQWTVSIFGGLFLGVGSVVSGIPVASPGAPLTLVDFLLNTFTFFFHAFAFDVPGAIVLSPIWWLMGIVWLVLIANFLRTGLS